MQVSQLDGLIEQLIGSMEAWGGQLQTYHRSAPMLIRLMCPPQHERFKRALVGVMRELEAIQVLMHQEESSRGEHR